MIYTLNNRHMDYSIIDINAQQHVDVERIREELNKEFEWDEPPLTLHALKKHWHPS
jgi:hypothetical protein